MSKTKTHLKSYLAGVAGALMVLAPTALAPSASAATTDPMYNRQNTEYGWNLFMQNLLPSSNYVGYCQLTVPSRPNFNDVQVPIGSDASDTFNYGRARFQHIKLDPQPVAGKDDPEMVVMCVAASKTSADHYVITPKARLNYYGGSQIGFMNWR